MKPLRLLPLLVFCCCLFNNSRAQYVTIPDATFAAYLQTLVPGCISGNQLDTTCSGVTGLTDISCTYMPVKDLTGIQYFPNLVNLNCYHDSLVALPPFPPRLKNLQCANNFLTALPPLTDSLYFLNCDSNYITQLPALPANINGIYCNKNQLTALPALPPQMRFLYCKFNLLTSLPALPDSIVQLHCDSNLLTALPALPDILYQLSCVNNSITALPALPSSLGFLACGGNQLTSLPALPPNLTSLICGPNNLSALPVLPPQLYWLWCGFNQLTTLPVLPASLQNLYCAANQFTSLPALPAQLTWLDCSHNQLTSLPELPGTMQVLICSNNPYLRCMPRLTTITTYLEFDSTGINCLPNYGNVTYSYPELSDYALCNPQNPYGCTIYWNIAGTVFNDTSSDCAQQPGETNVTFIKVNLLQNNSIVQQTYTGGYGSYSFANDTGLYTIALDTANLPFIVTCPVIGADTAEISSRDSVTYHKDFGLQCKPGFDVGAFSVASYYLFRPAGVLPVLIHAGDHAAFWGQTCNTESVGGQLVTTISGPATYYEPAEGALTPSSVAGNTLTYNISDWSAINPELDFNVKVLPDTTAQPGQQICFTIDVEPGTDNDATNNHLTQCFNVVASLDPNIKEVYPATLVDVDGDRWLTYTIHFQNTGSSYAENIYITDTLDADLNAETFQLLAYSFPPKVSITGRAVQFNFNGIMLQDSTTDEPNSHGYVQYKIKLKDNAGLGTTVTNTAYIYFDFNAPVVTNTTTNTVAQVNGIATLSSNRGIMHVYPNPAQDVVMINLSDNLTGGSLTISDVTGRALSTIQLTAVHNEINTSALSSGVYLVTAFKGGARVVQRLVVSR